MTEPGSSKPRVVRRTTSGQAAKDTRPAHTEKPASAGKPVNARRSAKAQAQEQAQTTPRASSEVPELSVSMYVAPTIGGRRGLSLLRLAGVLALLGSILVVVADFLPYLVLDGAEVVAGQDVWSILAHLVLLLLGGGAGVLMLVGRGGRVGPALVAALAATSLGQLLRHIFAGTDPVRHEGSEYYFGELYTTALIEGESGRLIAIFGTALLVVAGAAAAFAWSDIAERDMLPLGAGRRLAGGAAGLAALLAVTAYLIPSAATAIVKYTDPSGLVLTQELEQPQSMVTTSGLNLIGGILLLAGWLVAAAVVGAMTSRVTVVAALTGMGALALYGALLNLREITEGPNLVTGPRLYLLLAAALIALGTAWYSARVREDAEEPLLSV